MTRHNVGPLLPALLLSLCGLACGVEPSEEGTGASEGAVSSETSSVQARAFPETELAKASGCFACHKVEGKLIGPSFHEVAQRAMPNHPEAAAPQSLVERLATNIRKGSTSRWGFVPMPPNPNVSVDDATRLARAILESGPGSCGDRCDF